MNTALRLAILGMVNFACTSGQCLEPEIQNQIVNMVRWNGFWFGVPQDKIISERGVLLKSPKQTGALVAPSGLWVLFVPSATALYRRIIVLKTSGDLKQEEAEYRRYLERASSPIDAPLQITERCEFVLEGMRLMEPESQRATTLDPQYLKGATKFIWEQLASARCPCRYWMPYVDSTDPMGFALVEDRNKDRYFIGFYWELSSRVFVSLPSPANVPAYRRSEKLTEWLEQKILKTSRLKGTYPQ